MFSLLKVIIILLMRFKRCVNIKHCSMQKPKGSSTLNPDTIRFRTIRIQSRLNPLPIASTLAQYVARYVAQITSTRII